MHLVRLWHKADITRLNVRFWGQSGHHKNALQCPLLTQSGYRSSGGAPRFRDLLILCFVVADLHRVPLGSGEVVLWQR